MYLSSTTAWTRKNARVTMTQVNSASSVNFAQGNTIKKMVWEDTLESFIPTFGIQLLTVTNAVKHFRISLP